MKKLNSFFSILLLLLAVLFAQNSWGQSTANYTFSTATNGSLTDMSSGTTDLLPTGTYYDDNASSVTNIGFTFYFMGVPYTQFSVNSNGQLRLGSTVIVGTNQIPTASTALLAPINGDNAIRATGKVHYKLTGTSPNRVLVVEWVDLRIPFSSSVESGTYCKFQVRLAETSEIVEYVYGRMYNMGTNQTRGIYVSYGTAAGQIGQITTITTTPTYNTNSTSLTTSSIDNASSITNLNSTVDGSRRVFTFTPQSVSPSVPTNMTFTSLSNIGMTVNWTDNSTTETYFTLTRATDAAFTQNVTTTVVNSTTISGTGTNYSSIVTGLLPSTTYYYKVTANNEASAASSELTGNQVTNAPGNIISTTTGGNWNVTTTWVGDVVPGQYDNVTIADGATVFINAVSLQCYNLTVGQGTSGILRFEGTNARTFTVNGSVTVAANGTFDAGAVGGSSLTHTLYIGGSSATSNNGSGNLTVNGTFDMYIGSSNGKASITFYGVPDAIISGTGNTCDFNAVTLSKGSVTATTTVTPPILDVQRNFTYQGASTSGPFSISNGVLKISTAITSPVFNSTSYSIPATGGFWLNNASATISALGGSPTISGLLKISSGTYNVGIASHNMGISSGAVMVFEGGTSTFSARFAVSSASNITYFTQTGGIINVNNASAGNTSSQYYSFDMGTSSTSKFTMSGGTINIIRGSGTTNLGGYDYRGPATSGATINITGGTLNFGSASTAASTTYKILGVAPTTILNNTNNPGFSLSGATSIYGDLTLNGTGTFIQGFGNALTISGNSASNPGNLTSNGTMTLNGSDGNILTFNSSFGNQTFTNNGAITSSHLPQIVINNTYSGGIVTLPANMIIKPSNTYTGLTLTAGILTATNLTLGNGGSSGFKIAIGNGAFTNNPTYNLGTGTLSVIYNGTTSRTTGAELPSTIGGSLTINNAAGIILGNPTTAGTLTLTSGNLTTTSSNLLTISGTTVGSISRASGYINGPIARTLPLSLASGSTYLFPVGKSAYTPFELVNPTTNAGGTVIISAEVFDANCGGTSGTGMGALNADRYWNATITSGAANFTNTTVKLTEPATIASTKGIGQSATLNGVYNYTNSSLPSVATITTGTITSLDYFAIGDKAVNMTYASSTVTQNTSVVSQNTTNAQVIGIQVVTSGNNNPLSLSSFTVNANGSTNISDISNAKIYYTGTSSTFEATNLFGTVASPTVADFSIAGTQSLAEGTNYFWLTFDVSVNSTYGNLIDAECTSLTVGTSQTPSNNAPSGNRSVVLGTVTSLPFTDDFESGSLNTKWFVVNGSQTNKWFAGSAINNGGTKSAYVSNDNGTSNAYSHTTSVVHFYRDITFPASGDYQLSFDWKGLAESCCDYLKVYLINTSTTPTAGTAISSGQIGTTYNNQSSWQTATISIDPSNLGTTKRLVFSWANDYSTGSQPPIAIDNVVLKQAENMTYVSSTTTQSVVSSVNAGATSQEVIGIQVVTTGNLAPIDLTKLVVKAIGTTSVSDISNAKIYYTGTSSTFATSAQFGTTVATPTTANFDVTGTQTLAQGTNYFWLTYDIASTAVNANVIDAECTGVSVGGTDYTPTITAPAGTRAIVNKTITSVSGTQASTALVLQGATNQAVLRLDFTVAGPSGGSLLLNSIAATYTGTNASDIAASGVKLYTTAFTTFATTNPLGTALSFSGGIATFSGLNYNLPTGTSYVWVAFDIDANATVNNTVDAKIAINGIDVAGTTYPVAEIDPNGSRSVKAALAGTYTIGTGGNYTSFTKTDGLFADINSLGLSGNVTINVISDITDETGATALNQWTETGAGNYTLTIQPSEATERIISSSSAAHLFSLNGADRVTFDGRYSGSGKYLRIRNTNTGYATFRFTNSAQNNALKYCYVEGANITAASGVIDFLTTGNNNSNLIDNCIIRDRSDVSGRPANGFYFGGKANASNNIISNNEIFNFTTYGVNLYSATSTTISGNQFYMTSASTQNTVAAGIYIVDAPTTTISGNKIYDINGSSSAAVKGIYYYGGSGVSMNVDIVNNAINLNPTTTGNVDGIDYYGYPANSCNIYFNSVRIGGSTTAGSTYAFRKRAEITTMNINNNVFVNARSNSSGTAKHYAIAFITTTATTLSIDNNDYFTNGTGGVLGVYSSTDKTTLADWKAATTQDAASKSFNPGFTSATDLALLVSNNLGTPIAGIDVDYTGTDRDDVNPDMGAYESNVANAVTFNGATDAWEVAANWTPNAVPNYATNVTIPANKLAVVNSNNYECNNLTIAPKGELTINAGKDLLVNGALLLQSDATGTASLVDNGALVTSSNTAQRYIAKDNKWHFLSSPVAAQTIKPNFAPDVVDLTFDFFKWDQSDATMASPWLNIRASNGSYAAGFDNFEIGKGYLVAYSSNYGGSEIHQFTGTLNSGNQANIAVSNAGNTFNLIGNPFASALDWDVAGYIDRDIRLKNTNPSIWVWNGTSANYGAYTNGVGGVNSATNVIAPHQGFFVEAISTGNFTIPNAARVHPGTQNFLKSTPVDLLKLKVSSTANTYSDEIIVNFNSNATANQGAAKWFSMITQAPSLYSVKNNKNFSINTLPAISNNLIVPLGFIAGVNGNYSITASELNSFAAGTYIYLKDLKANTIKDLNQNATYSFAGLTSDNANRFQLIFSLSPLGVSNNEIQNTNVYAYNNTIYVNSNEAIKQIAVYNTLGQLIKTIANTNNQNHIDMNGNASGYYIVKVVTNKNVYSEKVLIK